MFSMLLVCAGLLAQSTPAPAPDQDAYKAAEAKAGRDPGAQIKLALWCEAHGLDAERLKHLARAVLIDPRNATARGLMGLVAYGGRWESPDEVSGHVKADEALSAKLAQYEARRAQLLEVVARLLDRRAIEAAVAPNRDDFEVYVTDRRAEVARRHEKAARAHMELALWCEQNGLKPEASAHFAEAAQLDPRLHTPWEHLGCKKHKGRWMTEEQIVAEGREAEAQRHADRHWEPLLRKWKTWLDRPSRRREAEDYLAKIADPRAVPSIWKVFVQSGARDQRRSVLMLSHVESPEATLALASLAVHGVAEDVRESATGVLLPRDPGDVISTLIDLLLPTLRYRIEPPRGWLENHYESMGVLVVEGDSYVFKRSYRRGIGRMGAPIVGSPLQPVVDGIIAQRLSEDIREIEQRNEAADGVNQRVVAALQCVTGQSLENDPDTWKRWWADQQGYVYEPLKTEDKALGFSNIRVVTHTACFGAGTLVRTFSGLRPIESIKLGDRVLAQDTKTGASSYQPVLAAHHNPPNPTLRISVAGEAITTTGIHRFWKPGRGWVMARDLKPGDVLRVVGGTARVELVGVQSVQPVYNLDVAKDRNFFVGRSGMLVHDFSLVDAVAEPFDAPLSQPSIALAK